MLSFPNIPTDSLYKFVFISGILMMVLSVYFYPKIALENLYTTTKLDSIATELKYSIVDERLYILGAKPLKDSLEKKHSNEKEILLFQKFDSIYHKHLNHYYNLKKDSLYLEQKRILSNGEYKIYNHIFIDLIIFGSMLAIIGGVCWYWFIQRFQDGILELQYLDLLKNNSPVSGRTHNEPKLLPRKGVKNR